MKTSIWHVALAIVLVTAIPVAAHHSFSAEFDRDKPFKVTGTIVKVEWTNPHIWFFVDVKNPDGTVTRWGMQGNPPGPMQRAGITKDRLKIGAEVVVEGSRMRDGSSNGYGNRITFPDGTSVLAGLPTEGGRGQTGR